MSKIPKEDVIPNGLMAGAILFFSGLVAFGLFGGSGQMPLGLLAFLFLGGFATIVIVYYGEKMESKERGAFLSNHEGTLVLEQTLLKWLEESNALRTILGQIVAGIICLVIGHYLFKVIFTIFTSNWDGSPDLAGVFMGDMALVIITVIVFAKQFRYALPFRETFRLSLKYSLIGFICFTALFLVIALSYPAGSMEIIAANVFVFLVIGLLNGLVQIVHLWIEQFEQKKFHWLLSNESCLLACKNGYIPYRHKVMVFWRIILFGAIWLGLVIALIITAIQGMPRGVRETESTIGLLAGIFMLPFLFYFVFKEFTFLFSKDFHKTQGMIKKQQDRSGYYLVVDQATFITDAETWNQITSYGEYILWYSPKAIRSGRVVAYEVVKLPILVHKRQKYE